MTLLPLLLAATLASSPADPAPDFAPHIALSAGLLAAAGTMTLAKTSLIGSEPNCRRTAEGLCSPAGLTALDRWSLGRTNAAWRRVSDVGEILGIAAPAATLLTLAIAQPDADASGLSEPWDLLIWAETLSITAFADEALKLTLRRPRPICYSQMTSSAEAQVSFPSGHALAASAGTTALTTLLWQRYPDSPWRWAVLAGGVAVTAVTGWGRVEGGKHFVSDVLAGWILGATLGFAHPYLLRHHLQLALQPVASVDGGGQALSLKGHF